jgi:PAS domain S-box-containing protein
LIATIQAILENIGAQCAYLILRSDDRLQVVAAATVDANTVKALQSIPLEECQGASTAIVRHVNRTGETVVLHNAAQEGMFVGDPHVTEHQCRSVLCMPVCRQDEPIGVLYLEDNRVTGAFTQHRVEALNVLLTRAAISLESARRARLGRQVQGLLDRRERQIWASTQIAQEIAAAGKENDLYKRVVTVVKEHLGYYHTQMFRCDLAQKVAVLVAGYGGVGRQMLDEGHRVLAGAGPVGAAMALGTSVLRPDLASDPGYRPHPHLQHAVGELAVPIKLDQWDVHAQITVVQGFIDGGLDGFVVFPLDDAAMAPVAKEALDKGISVVSTNSLGPGNQTAQVGFHEYENGHMLGRAAGRWAKQHLEPGETLKLAIFGMPGAASVVQRTTGMLDGIRSVFADVQLVDVAVTGDRIQMLPVAQQWLQTWPDLHMILGINDIGALGAYAAVSAAGKNDADTFFIGGLDATDEALSAIGEGGAFQATIDQSPRKVAALTTRTLVAAIAGQPYERQAFVAGTLVTRDNLDEFLAQQQTQGIEEYGALDGLDLSGIRIGLNVVDLPNPFFVTLAKAAGREADRLGVELVVTDSRQVLGVLDVQSDQAGQLDAEDQLVLEGLCGQIATAVKSLRLLDEIKQARDGLEQRVEERTAELQQEIAERVRLERRIQSSLARRERQILASTQVSQLITVANEEAELFRRTVAVIKEQLGYYHAQMFRYDPAQEAAVLVAGYGRAGRQMLDEGYQVPAGTGPVGAAVALGMPVLRPDVTTDASYRPHPHLPHVKGELAVPIKLDQWDARAQMMAIQSFIDGNLNGFVAIVIDEAAAAPMFREALDKGLCVVSTNSVGEDSLTAEICLADYDNGYRLGEQAGEWAKRHLSPGETLNLAMFDSPPLAQIVQREVGIMDGIRSVFPDVRLVDTAATAAPARTMPIARRWLEAWPDLHAILGINDSGALGAYAAVIAAGKNDADTFFIGGIDATDEALDAIGEGGAFQATIDQSPKEIGVLAVRTLVAAIVGRPYDKKRIIAGVLVSRGNLETFLAQRRTGRFEEGTLDDLDLSGIRIGMNVIDLQNPFFVEMAEAAMEEAERLGVDLLVNDSRQVLGVLSVQSSRAGQLNVEDQLVLEGLCGQIATAVKSLRLFGELKHAHDSLERRVEERTAELRESEERFRALAENIPGTIYLRRNDERRTTLYLNDAVEQLTGYPKESFLSHRIGFVDLYHPDDAGVILAQVKEALDRHIPFHLVYRLKHRSGEWRWIEEFGIGIYRDGELQMLEGFLTDVTERRQTEEAMVQASRLEATATLAGGIAHQFNNLMVGVLGYAEILKTELAGDPGALNILDTVSRSAQQAGELAKQMLAFARGGRHQSREINLNDAVRNVLYAQESLLPARIHVTLDTDLDLWDVEADPAQISQVFLNVLTNAVEAIEDDGQITISTRNVVLEEALDSDLAPGPYACLTVRDTGHGMSPEVQNRIFEPFYTTKFQGRGLGLAAVYGIVRNHGGHVAVDSMAGRGTTIEIYLPAVRTEVTDLSAHASTTETLTPAADTRPATVLVVEDEGAVQKLVRRLLEHLGYEVLIARSGQQAIEIARGGHRIDVVLLDIEMPGMGGAEVYPLLVQARPGIKTVLYSGYELDAGARALLSAGASAFVRKPFGMRELEAAIREALGQRKVV